MLSFRARIGFIALVCTGALVVVWTASIAVYMRTMFDRNWSSENVIEAVSFATQTVTTVGYGNWESPASGVRIAPARLSTMRLYSSAFMIVGATLYALFTGLMVAALCPQQTGT
jgi:hypothetical protein